MKDKEQGEGFGKRHEETVKRIGRRNRDVVGGWIPQKLKTV